MKQASGLASVRCGFAISVTKRTHRCPESAKYSTRATLGRKSGVIYVHRSGANPATRSRA